MAKQRKASSLERSAQCAVLQQAVDPESHDALLVPDALSPGARIPEGSAPRRRCYACRARFGTRAGRAPPGAVRAVLYGTRKAQTSQSSRARVRRLEPARPQAGARPGGPPRASMHLSDFWYELPPDLIAQRPLRERGASRLLAVDGTLGESGARRRDLAFADLPRLLRPGDLLVFNDTQVMRARLFGRKETGGRVEVLIERVLNPDEALAHVRASRSPVPGSRLEIGGGSRLLVLGREGGLFRLRSEGPTFAALMSERGHLPLPPYIRRSDDALDESRYQTVYARRIGAVAAPTAGLHFDEPMLHRLERMGVGRVHVTLHVGAGTFQPVRVEDLEQHEMHAEWIEVSEEVCRQVRSARQRGGRVVAVGTTSVRSLETAAATGELEPFRGDSRLFIRPGFRFRVVDAMITNFHLPESTLLMLVSAFAGHHAIMEAYRHAVASRYRFFSYGDAMFLIRNRRESDSAASARS